MTTNTTITIAPDVRGRMCPLCDAAPGRPCQPKPEGDHLARYLEAHISGALTREYMAAVLAELVVVDASVVIEGVLADVPPSVRQRLDAGHTITYVADVVWDAWWCDLRDAKGRMIECGGGTTKRAALADLARRLGGAR